MVPIASYIEHTLLRPAIAEEELQRLCQEAKEHGFYGVCVPLDCVTRAAGFLGSTPIRIVTVVGFPHGAPTAQKVKETEQAVLVGAHEIDMVMQWKALKQTDYAAVHNDIQSVVAAAQGKVVKVILEAGALSQDELCVAGALAKLAGATFVKTSTGVDYPGARAEEVSLLRKIVGPELGIKASGGIRTREQALSLIAAGANRIGTSASVSIAKSA